MPALARSAASLRVRGDDLDPSEVTKLLGAAPTLARAKGDLMKHGASATARGGLWLLRAKETAPAGIDRQVEEIFAQLPADLKIWRSLAARYHVDLFCGWFMNENNEGLEISADTLTALGNRGIKLAFDLYAPIEE